MVEYYCSQTSTVSLPVMVLQQYLNTTGLRSCSIIYFGVIPSHWAARYQKHSPQTTEGTGFILPVKTNNRSKYSHFPQ